MRALGCGLVASFLRSFRRNLTGRYLVIGLFIDELAIVKIPITAEKLRELVCELLGDKHAVVIEQSADLMLLFRFAVPGLKNLSFFIKDLRDPNVTVGSDITPAAVGKDEETKVAEVFARGHFAH